MAWNEYISKFKTGDKVVNKEILTCEDGEFEKFTDLVVEEAEKILSNGTCQWQYSVIDAKGHTMKEVPESKLQHLSERLSAQKKRKICKSISMIVGIIACIGSMFLSLWISHYELSIKNMIFFTVLSLSMGFGVYRISFSVLEE